MSLNFTTDTSTQLTYSSFGFATPQLDNFTTSNKLLITSNNLVNYINTKQNLLTAATNLLGVGSAITALDYTKITLNKPTNFQADWTSTVINKPTNFQSDWLTTIINKPSTFPADMTNIYTKTETNNISNSILLLSLNFTSNLIYNTNYTEERTYPPKLFNSSTSQSLITYLNQTPTYYETFTLTTADITYGSGIYEVRSSSIDNTIISFTGTGSSLNNVAGNTDYVYIIFTNSGTFTIDNNLICDILIVGGGGGGGYNGGGEGGGGGGSGGIGIGTINFSSGTYNINIGNGGNGGATTNTTGQNGSNTTIIGGAINEMAYGGGGGGWKAGANGGSGGGGSGYATNNSGGTATRGLSSSGANATITYYGNDGGYGYWQSGGSGGGGAGAQGSTTGGIGASVNGANGGIGILSSITGISTYYGGGGGGGSGASGNVGGTGGLGGGGNGGNPRNPQAGIANSGGGGGGANGGSGGSGGSGIVIIRYLKSITSTKKELFNLITNDNGSSFKTNQYNSTTGNYLTTDRYINNYYGDWIIIKKPNPIYLIKYQIYNRPSFIENAPSLFKIFASTDGITYDEITEASNTTPLTTLNYSSGYFEKIVNYYSKAYSYFALIVNKIIGGNINAHLLNFTEFKIFGKEFLSNTKQDTLTAATTLLGVGTAITAIDYNKITVNKPSTFPADMTYIYSKTETNSFLDAKQPTLTAATTLLGTGGSITALDYNKITVNKPTTFAADMTNIYTKTETNNLLDAKQPTLTAATTLLGTGGSITALDYNKITVNKPSTFPADMTNIYTKTETNSFLDAKQATLTAATTLLGTGGSITALDYNKITVNKPTTFSADMTNIYSKTETNTIITNTSNYASNISNVIITNVNNNYLKLTGGTVSGLLTTANIDCGGGIAINGSTAFYNPSGIIDAGNLTNTYMNLKFAGTGSDWCYIRQIGGDNAYKLAFDFHDDNTDANFCIRSITSTANPDNITEVFKVENGNTTMTGICTATSFSGSVPFSSLTGVPSYVLKSGDTISGSLTVNGHLTVQDGYAINFGSSDGRIYRTGGQVYIEADDFIYFKSTFNAGTFGYFNQGTLYASSALQSGGSLSVGTNASISGTLSGAVNVSRRAQFTFTPSQILIGGLGLRYIHTINLNNYITGINSSISGINRVFRITIWGESGDFGDDTANVETMQFLIFMSFFGGINGGKRRIYQIINESNGSTISYSNAETVYYNGWNGTGGSAQKFCIIENIAGY